MSIDDAVRYALNEYDAVGPGDIRWYIPEYWFSRFELGYDLLDDLLGIMEDHYYYGMYDDVYLLEDIGKRYRVIISTCNPPAMAGRKLSTIMRRYAGVRIDALFSSISYNMVKSRAFYSMICREMGLRPESILHLGDDMMQDVEIPRSVGMQAVLMHRGCREDMRGHMDDIETASSNHSIYESSHAVSSSAVALVCSIKELMDMLGLS